MADKFDEPEPVICSFCKKEIEKGHTFLEVRVNLGVKESSGGYVKGETHKFWDTDTNYIHLNHILFTRENM